MSPPLPSLHACHARVASFRTHGSLRHLAVAVITAVAIVLSATPAVAADVATGSPASAPMPSPLPGQAVEQAAANVAIDPAPAAEPYVFATVGTLELLTPSPRPILVGFHQAAGGTVALTPVSGQVLPPRGRGTAPTSAVDVALEPDDPVLAVVTGTVTEVSPYALYGRHPDVLVTIVPDGRPDLRVRLLHIDDVRVTPGQHVTAGRDVIAGTARGMPVSNQVDRFTGRALPHLHLEVLPG